MHPPSYLPLCSLPTYVFYIVKYVTNYLLTSDGHRLAIAVTSDAAMAGHRCGWLRPRSMTFGGCGQLHVLIIMRLATAVAERP